MAELKENTTTPFKPTSPNNDLDVNGFWMYDEAPESTSHVTIDERYDLFIGGKFVKPEKGRYFNSVNPANGEVLAEVAEATQQDVDKAVKAARKAFKGEWSSLNPKTRGKYLFRIARMLQERAREFAVLESMDGGKPIRESRDIDIPIVASYFFYYAGWADKLEYAFPGKKPEPVGVCGQIIPWNFPLLMLAWKIAPALACGNTVVLKPAETTSLTALAFARLLQDVGLPDGVVNIVTGAGQTGAEIVRHSDIDKIAFTGSTNVGKLIRSSLAGTDKRYSLELGGKGALIIFEDAAIDQAVEGVINGIFFNQGHVCCAGSRLLVQESVADEVYRRLQHRMNSLIVGDPLDKNTDIGAINSEKQFDTIGKYLKIAADEGADIYQPDCSLPENGYFVPPTLLTNVSQADTVVKEEIFGPVLTIQTFRTPDEAIEKANNSPYGLAGGVWTDKGSKIFKVGSEIKSGVVWANTYNKFDPTSPFGGYKESGEGREGGLHGLYPYVQLK